MADSLAPDAVGPLLRGRFGSTVYHYAELAPSTQRMLGENDPEGAIALVEEQSEGRGRLGRTWQAPPGTSLLFSVLLQPAVESSQLPEAIAEVTGLQPAVKFPNDVLIGGRKVAGILAESSEGKVVLGVGINVNQTLEQLPENAQTRPTSLRLEVDGPVDRARLLAAVLVRLEGAYDAWVSGTSAPG